MTEPDSAVRFMGIAIMFVGSVLAGSAYLVPIVLRARASSQVSLESGGGMAASGDRAATSVANGERPSTASAFPT